MNILSLLIILRIFSILMPLKGAISEAPLSKERQTMKILQIIFYDFLTIFHVFRQIVNESAPLG